MPLPVLIVEDSPTQQAALDRVFADMPQFSVAARLPTEAAAALWLDQHSAGWGLAVIDLILEEGTGMAVIAKCRGSRPEMAKIVVLSSYATPGVTAHCLKLGADAVFQKGAGFEAFSEYVRASCAPEPL